MNIYFCGSISGGRNYLETYQEIVKYLKSKGHNILTEHVVAPDVLELESQLSDREIYHRDIEWLENCDCIIAEVSNPSLGVGYEISYALNLEKPVLCLYQEGIFLTRMILGNQSPGLCVNSYETGSQWQASINKFLEEV